MIAPQLLRRCTFAPILSDMQRSSGCLFDASQFELPFFTGIAN